MFSNLIESSPHTQEFKRRGSFLLFTTATYALLLLITGVVSIYAYDARLGQQNLDLDITLLTPDMLPSDPGPARAPAAGPNRPINTADPVNTHQPTIATVEMPQVAPDKVSSTPGSYLPPIGPRNFPIDSSVQPGGPGGGPGGPGSGSGGGRQNIVVLPDEQPPPVPTPTPAPKILRISKGPINSRALSLPKPIYPPIAKTTKTQGIVNVQVLIDEHGNVISAKAVSGHPFLVPEAQRAAMQAKFSPAFIGDQPVKVSGVISYNFVMQ